MNDRDDHVIPYEDAVRRHRALEAEKRRSVSREVRISDAMSHLLEAQDARDQAGQTPAHLRGIVEREFAADERTGGEPDGDEASRTLDRRSRED